MATLPARCAINARLRSIVANAPFPWRHRVSLGFLGLAVAWSVLTDFWSATPIPSEVEGVLEVAFIAAIASIAISINERALRSGRIAATTLAGTEAHRQLLATAVEQTDESVLICDATGTILYANPGFERVTGYRANDVIGSNPRFMQSGQQPPAFYRQMWETLVAGRTWTGELVNRRCDGSLFVDQSSITPIRDGSSTIIRYVSVQRDVTRLRALESSLNEIVQERADIATSLARIPSGGSIEATAAAICRELVRLRDVDFAAMNVFEGDEAVVVVGVAGMPMPIGTRLPRERSRVLRGRAASGAWTEAWKLEPAEGRFGEVVEAAGVKAVAISPITNGTVPVGMLLIGACTTEGADRLVERLPALVEFATTTNGLIGAALLARREQSSLRDRIAGVIAGGAFESVFQPVVDLTTARAIGYEGLTRFADGTPPDEVFGVARQVGLGHELEIATLECVLREAETLPPRAWLSINLSASLVVTSLVSRLLAKRTRPIVIEITEHERIEDYAAVRNAIVALGADVRVAVDDAGSGVANFGHIVELRPDFVKLDANLIRDLNADLTRQALVVGLMHFALATGHYVIAEGIETDAELQALR